MLLPWISFNFFSVVREEFHNVFASFSTLSSSSRAPKQRQSWSEALAGNLWAAACRCWVGLCCWAWCGGHRWVHTEILSIFASCFYVSVLLSVRFYWHWLCCVKHEYMWPHIHVPALLTGSQNFSENHLWQKRLAVLLKCSWGEYIWKNKIHSTK